MRWEYLESKRPHTHDVRTLCVVTPANPKVPVLVSGGQDAQLFAYKIPQFTKVFTPPGELICNEWLYLTCIYAVKSVTILLFSTYRSIPSG